MAIDFSNWSPNDFNTVRKQKRTNEKFPGNPYYNDYSAGATEISRKYGADNTQFSSADMDAWANQQNRATDLSRVPTDTLWQWHGDKQFNEQNPTDPSFGVRSGRTTASAEQYGIDNSLFPSEYVGQELTNRTTKRAYGDNEFTTKAKEMYGDILGGYGKYNGKSSREADAVYKELEQFDYDPETDALFQVYRNRNNRESAAAQEGTYANFSQYTGGRNNSWASAATAQVGQAYAQKISDMIPTLAENAYDKLLQRYKFASAKGDQDYQRWLNDREFNMAAADRLYTMGQNDQILARGELMDRQQYDLNDIAIKDARMRYGIDEHYLPLKTEEEYYQMTQNSRIGDQGIAMGDIDLEWYPKEKQLAYDQGVADKSLTGAQEYALRQGVDIDWQSLAQDGAYKAAQIEKLNREGAEAHDYQQAFETAAKNRETYANEMEVDENGDPTAFYIDGMKYSAAEVYSDLARGGGRFYYEEGPDGMTIKANY